MYKVDAQLYVFTCVSLHKIFVLADDPFHAGGITFISFKQRYIASEWTDTTRAQYVHTYTYKHTHTHTHTQYILPFIRIRMLTLTPFTTLKNIQMTGSIIFSIKFFSQIFYSDFLQLRVSFPSVCVR